jgi:hypothetical protein
MRTVVIFTAPRFKDLLTAEASSQVLTDFLVVLEVQCIEGELLFNLVLIELIDRANLKISGAAEDVYADALCVSHQFEINGIPAHDKILNSDFWD